MTASDMEAAIKAAVERIEEAKTPTEGLVLTLMALATIGLAIPEVKLVALAYPEDRSFILAIGGVASEKLDRWSDEDENVDTITVEVNSEDAIDLNGAAEA